MEAIRKNVSTRAWSSLLTTFCEAPHLEKNERSHSEILMKLGLRGEIAVSLKIMIIVASASAMKTKSKSKELGSSLKTLAREAAVRLRVKSQLLSYPMDLTLMMKTNSRMQ